MSSSTQDLRPFKQAVRQRLLPWFGRVRRPLPWRKNRTPYRVWVAEIMLQQTRADQATPYYQRFLKAFPSLRSLAEAPLDRVLKQWEGLGYYSRARRMHETARFLVAERNGRFPRTYDGLLALPGIGAYTAAAVASLAMNIPAAVVDGNVIRVLSRLMAYTGDARAADGKRRIATWATALMPENRPGDYNEALMELGATVCLPRKPLCPTCPLRAVCRAHKKGNPLRYPRPPRRRVVPHKVVGAAVTVRSDGRLLIARRRDEAMLGGLWEFPGGTLKDEETMRHCIRRELKEELGIEIVVGEPIITVQHAYSHFTIELHAHWARIRKGRPRVIECSDFAWVTREELGDYAFSRADIHIIEALARISTPGGAVPPPRTRLP